MAPEVFIFFQACLLGVLLGALYDGFRILRLAFPNGKVLIFFEDILYFFVVTVASFSFVLLYSGGVLRAFMLFGELLGAILYFFTVSLVVMKAAGWIIRIVKCVLRFLYRLFIRPFVRFFGWILQKGKKWCRNTGKACKKFVLKHKKHLKTAKDIMYNDTVLSCMQENGAAATAAEWDANNGERCKNKGKKKKWNK